MAKYLSFWWVAAFVFVLDRITKLLVLEFIPQNSSIDLGFFSLTYITNTGTLFGLFKDASWFFALFAIIISVYLILRHSSFSRAEQPILGLVLGGALGNLVDRLVYGSVIDFIDFHFWPVFNVADMSVSIAIILLIVLEFRKK